MKTCHECKLEIPQDQICHDIFGGSYHPQCYIDAYPPHPGPQVDPERLKAFELVSKTSK